MPTLAPGEGGGPSGLPRGGQETHLPKGGRWHLVSSGRVSVVTHHEKAVSSRAGPRRPVPGVVLYSTVTQSSVNLFSCCT